MTRPTNPVKELRASLKAIYDYVGPEEAGPVLASKFSASTPEDVNVGLLLNAIEALHEHTDFLEQPKDPQPEPQAAT